MYAKKLKTTGEKINKYMWGEYYFNKKTNKITTPKQAAKLRNNTTNQQQPMFVEFGLNNIWSIYQSVVIKNDHEKIKKIINSLNLKVMDRDIKSKNTKQLLSSIFRQWLPISNCVLCAVIELIPSPLKCKAFLKVINDAEKNHITNSLYNHIQKCSGEGPVVAYISKTFYVDKKDLHSKELTLLADEHQVQEALELDSSNNVASSPKAEDHTTLELMGIARIYSGTIKRGQKIYLLGPKYSKGSTEHVFEIKVTGLYIIMGKDFHPLQEIGAGNIFGLTGISTFVNKYATLTTSLECPNLCVDNKKFPPIMKVAIEPFNPSDIDKLEAGLKLLALSDPVAEVSINKNGEFILSTAGELHLERCLTDLKERFIDIEIQTSDPIVPFRETILFPINDEQKQVELASSHDYGNAELSIIDGLLKIKLRILPLTQDTASFLQLHMATIKSLCSEANDDSLNTEASTDISGALVEKTMKYGEFIKHLKDINSLHDPSWPDLIDRLWSFGPNRIGPNILINNMSFSSRSFYKDKVVSDKFIVVDDLFISLKQIEDTLNNAFQLFTESGPLCMEPISGICCIVNDILVNSKPVDFTSLKDNESKIFDYKKKSLIIGGIISEFKEVCKKAFCEWPQRIMLAMFECNILTTIDVLGKVYSVINQRKGQIISEEVKEGSTMYSIKANIPVIESLKFGEEVYKRTSGLAFPHLNFNGFKILDIDPNWYPKTKDEIEEFGDNLERANLAKNYINNVRRKKGLLVEEKVIKAEKQRTLKK